MTPEQYFKQITKRLAEIKAVSVSVLATGVTVQINRARFGSSSEIKCINWRESFTLAHRSTVTSVVLFQSPDERGIIVQILESGYRFVLGSIGGGTSYRP